MAVRLNVDWSNQAVSELSDFYDQILSLWGKKEAEHFLDLVQEFERLVSLYPKAFIKTGKRKNNLKIF